MKLSWDRESGSGASLAGERVRAVQGGSGASLAGGRVRAGIPAGWHPPVPQSVPPLSVRSSAQAPRHSVGGRGRGGGATASVSLALDAAIGRLVDRHANAARCVDYDGFFVLTCLCIYLLYFKPVTASLDALLRLQH